jgi:enterochelin esterase family protein
MTLRTVVAVPDTSLGTPVRATVWTPSTVKQHDTAGWLVVHDGPAYEEHTGLTALLETAAARREIPPLRVALLNAGRRERWYAADPRYARALAVGVLPRLRALRPTTWTLGLGTSLGALAWLYCLDRYPDAADGLLLQSGSFFTARTDPQEAGFARFAAVTSAVAALGGGPPATRPIPMVLTCGRDEENLANNRLMGAALAGRGHPVVLHEVDGGHDFAAWGQALSTYLPRLLTRVAATAPG